VIGRAAAPNAPLWWAALAAICASLLAPLLISDVPPLLDYPDHLARAWLLAFGAADPVLSKIYVPHWAIIPNLATDLIWPPLMRVVPVYVAGRIVIGAMVLLPVLGTVAYHRACFGVRSWWPLAAGLVGYHAAVLLGFLNFDISLGVALLLAAGWISWRNSHPLRTVLLVGVGAVVLFFCHLMGVVFFAMLIGMFELDCVWHERRPAVIAARFGMVVAVLAVPAALYMVSRLQSVGGPTFYLGPAAKAKQLLLPFINYNYTLDAITAALVLGFLALCLATRRAIATPTTALALAVTLLAYLASPFVYKGTASLDSRFPILLGFLLFAAIRPVRLPRWATIAAAGVFTGLFAVRMAVLATVWAGHNADLAGLRAVTATLKPGDRVYVTSVTPDEAPGYWAHANPARRLSNGIRLDYHMAALVLIEHRAFWPYLFANPAQQPIRLTPKWQPLAQQAANLPGHRRLAACTDDDGPLSAANIGFRGYNYLLMLEAGGARNLAGFDTKRFALVARSDMAALFRIRTPIPPCALRVSAR
jgi:hypothetical protein